MILEPSEYGHIIRVVPSESKVKLLVSGVSGQVLTCEVLPYINSVYIPGGDFSELYCPACVIEPTVEIPVWEESEPCGIVGFANSANGAFMPQGAAPFDTRPYVLEMPELCLVEAAIVLAGYGSTLQIDSQMYRFTSPLRIRHQCRIISVTPGVSTLGKLTAERLCARPTSSLEVFYV